MPGGLQGVEQVFSADASGYISEIQAMIKANQSLVQSVAEAKRAAGDAGRTPGGADDIARTNTAIRETLATLREVQPAMAAAQSATGDYSTVVKYLGSAHSDLAPLIRATTAAAADQASVMRDQVTVVQAAADAVTGHADSLGVQQERVAAVSQAMRDWMQNAEAVRVKNEALSGSADTASDSLVQQAVNLGALRDTARDTTSALADTAAAAGALRGGAAGPATVSILGPALAAAVAQAAGQPSPWAAPAGAVAAQIAANVARNAGGGGGGGGGGGPFLGGAAGGLLAGGGGGGGGGGRGGGGGFVPWAGGGWQAVRFWGMMGAEIASTVVPAVVAAGSAALVGAQGFEQLQGRAAAVYTVSEALGSSLNKTAGQFFGVGNALQNAQNAAGGGVYGLAGAGINILKSGAGTGFLQEGTNTLAMLDRAAAGAVLNVTQGGTGKKLTSALAGGTGYLQQFGEIGANLGSSLLNFAPDLPGVGSDLLSTLTGATGALRSASGLPAPLLKSFFTYEAASRWLPAILGGKGLIGRMLGLRGVGGVGGLLGKIGLGEAGDALAGLTGPEVGIPVAAYQLESSLLDKYTATGASATASADIAQWQTQVANSGFTGAFQPLAHGITAAAAGAAAAPYVAAPTREQLASRVGAGIEAAYKLSPKQQYEQAVNTFAGQIGELVDSAPQLAGALKKAGMKGVTLADALQIAQNALLDIPHSFGPGGKINKQAMQQYMDYVATVGPMTQSAGGFGAAVAGTQIMSSAAMQNLAKVNQAMDSMTQIMEAGPTGMSSLAAAKGAVTPGMAHALTSFTSPGGQAAWNAFASTSTTTPGIVTQLQQFNDQMRTGLTLGALSQGQAAGLTGYELKQFLPQAKQSPAALAMLMQQGAQQGVTGYYDPSKSQAQNYAAAVAATSQIADNAQQANAAMTSMTVHLANLPKVAQQFAQGTGAAIQAQQIAKAAQDAMNIKGGINVKANTADLISQLKAAGVQGGAALRASLDAVLQQAGVGKAERIKIEAQVTGTPAVQALKMTLASLQSKTVTATAVASGRAAIAELGNLIAALQSRTVVETTVVQTIYTSSGQYAGTVAAGAAQHAVAPSAGGNAWSRIHGQSGFRVPGFGGGDIFPAMLEPGEAVVPKHLVGAVAPFLSAHNVPGFAGGMIPSAMMNLGAMAAQMSQLPGGGLPIPAIAQQVLDTLLAELSKAGAWKQAGVSIINGITYSLSGTGTDASKVGKQLVSETTKAANALAAQIQTEMNYARGVAAATVAGQGYGTQGLISGFTATPGPTGAGAAPPGAPGYNAAAWNAATANAASDTAPAQTVQQQMQSYLSSVKAFTKDLATLHKDHLSKAIISQLEAAGPVQGDALAQSILGGAGGVKGANALWNQIGQASKGLGAQAAMAQYGGIIAPDLKSGTFSSNNITINVNVPGGGTGNLPLTAAQIKTLTEEIQAKLLQQARRNNKTGLQARGKGA